MLTHRNRTALPLLLVLSACALSPQLVNVHPDLQTGAGQRALAEAALGLEVRDGRGDTTLGRRGGVYSETATLTTSGDITAPIRQSLAEALTGMGYRVINDGSVPVLTVEVVDLGYSVEKNRVTRDIATRAGINAVYRAGNRTYTNTYRASRSREMLTPPTASENEALINETLSAALTQLLSDRQLFSVIETGAPPSR